MLVEQPLPAIAMTGFASIARRVAVCADESVHDRASLTALAGKYDAVNIKLDKTGGVTEALKLAAELKPVALRSWRDACCDLARDGAGDLLAQGRAWSIWTARCFCKRIDSGSRLYGSIIQPRAGLWADRRGCRECLAARASLP